MSVLKKGSKQGIALLLALMLAIGCLPYALAEDAAETMQDDGTYYFYRQRYASAARPEKEIPVDLTQYSAENAGTVQGYQNQEGSASGLHIQEDCNKITFPVTVTAAGLYGIELVYYPYATTDMQIMFSLEIDGQLPFTEANSCVLPRVFINEPISQDEKGNDIRPRSTQTPMWRTQFLYDQTGVHGNLAFYLEEGEHELTFTFEEAEMLVQSITLRQEPYVMAYKHYISLHEQQGHQDTNGVQVIVQAENYAMQSSANLWPQADRTSPLTQPYDYYHTRLNIGGGSQWKQPGQWITWTFDVPENGFYNLGVKYKQGYLDGLFSSRRILIDGQVPFAEFNAVRFNYTTSWTNQLLDNGYEPYSIYLTKGTHTLTMENVLGDMQDTIGVLQTAINRLNDLYLSIVMVTGSEPDKYRDYYLAKQLPTLSDDLNAVADLLFAEAERLISVVGARGQETAFFEDIGYDLNSYAANITDITFKNRLENLKNNITSLSAKMTAYQDQALDIDYFVISSADTEMPRVDLGAGEWVAYQAKSLGASFDIDDKENSTVRVWMAGGNEQYETLQRMIDDVFTPETGIEVELELVAGSLIQAVASGTGPDVYIGIGGETIVNMAIRGALAELDSYPGYEELLAEYVPGSDIPYTLEGHVYGIPNTGAFSMLFVRTDVFEQLNLEIPKTWDDVYDVAQVLQRHNMSLGVVPSFATLLYQNGGRYYNEELTKVMFDETVAVEAMTQHTEFYTKYDFPITYTFDSRFRTGEMPIAIAGYSTYNSLKYAAPEISGLWEMFPCPGTLKEDGTIDSTQAVASGAGVVMLESARDKDAAWAFIRWWSGHDAQQRYGQDLEAAMGVSARYGTLNMIAFPNLGWTRAEFASLSEGIAQLRFTPIVPGDYYVSRGLNNTFRAVVYDGENVRENLREWTKKINRELERKRNEFYKNN